MTMAWALVGAFLCGSLLGFVCLSGEERLGGLNLSKSELGAGRGLPGQLLPLGQEPLCQVGKGPLKAGRKEQGGKLAG